MILLSHKRLSKIENENGIFISHLFLIFSHVLITTYFYDIFHTRLSVFVLILQFFFFFESIKCTCVFPINRTKSIYYNEY